MKLTTATAAELAIQMVIMDAIKKGMNPIKTVEYMATETFERQVQNYIALLQDQF